MVNPSNPSASSPVLFVGHGAPTLALDPAKGKALAAWGQKLGKPRALLVVSAHWTAAGPSIGSTQARDLIYDFYGFPQALYQVQYPAAGAPDLARRVAALLESQTLTRQDDRGLDHGVWVPLLHLFPKADVPVLQLSLPIQDGPQALFELGRKLAPLREEGVLIVGSGNLTHNLRRVDPHATEPPNWAADFDAWCHDNLERMDIDALINFRTRGPAVRENHPTEEHYLPLLVSLGSASKANSAAQFPVVGFDYGSISMRSVQLG